MVKHAGAKETHITLTFEDEALSVRIRDDGRGFDTRSTGSGKRVSWGLKNIEERAMLLGGTFKIYSYKDGGTIINVTVPYSQESQEG